MGKRANPRDLCHKADLSRWTVKWEPKPPKPKRSRSASSQGKAKADLRPAVYYGFNPPSGYRAMTWADLLTFSETERRAIEDRAAAFKETVGFWASGPESYINFCWVLDTTPCFDDVMGMLDRLCEE